MLDKRNRLFRLALGYALPLLAGFSLVRFTPLDFIVSKHFHASVNRQAPAPVEAVRKLNTAPSTPRSSRVQSLPAFASAFLQRSQKNPATALAAIPGLSEPYATIAMEAWAEAQVAEPAAALRLIEKLDNKQWARALASALVRILSTKMPLQEVTRLFGTEGLLSAAEVQNIFNDARRDSDLGATVAAFRANPGQGIQLLRELARWNPRSAADLAMELVTGSNAPAAFAAIAEVWIKSDADGAVAWIGSLDSDIRERMVPGLVESVASKDPYSLPLLAKSIPAEEWNAKAIIRMADMWTRFDPVAGVQWMSSIPALSVNTISASLQEMLADPAVARAVLSFLGNQQLPPSFESILSYASCAGLEPADALESAKGLKNPTARRAGAVAAIMAGLEKNPNFMNEEVLRSFANDDRDAILASVASRWAGQDFDSAWKWIQGEAGQNSRVWPAALTAALRNENLPLGRATDATLDWLAKQPPDIFGRSDISSLGTTLAREAFRETGQAETVGAMLERLPPGPARDAATATLAHEATVVDPYSASRWIDTLQAGAVRDDAVQALVRSIPNDPATAFQWACTITDPAMRLNSIRGTLTQLRSINPDLAQQAIRNLSESDLHLLRKDLP